MWENLYSLVFILLQVACGIAIVICFRGSLGAVFGGLAFGLWAASGATKMVLNALEIQWWRYGMVFALVEVVAYGSMLTALIIGRRAKVGAAAEVQTPGIEGEPVDSSLAGIGGWLILPAIGLVLGPVIGLIGLGVSVSLFSDVADAGYGGVYALEILVDLALLGAAVYAAIRFFGKKRNAPSILIGLMIAGIAVTLLLLVIQMGADAEAFAMQSVKTLLGSILGAAIWIPYFRTSRRVKATFVH